MADHEAMCPARREIWDDGSPFASPGECRCEEYARVRADERASAYPGREIRSQLLEALQKEAALDDQLAVARAEVADLRETVRLLRKSVAERRTRMNDLWAKVEALPRTSESEPADWYEVAEVVLPLIEEAQHG